MSTKKKPARFRSLSAGKKNFETPSINNPTDFDRSGQAKSLESFSDKTTPNSSTKLESGGIGGNMSESAGNTEPTYTNRWVDTNNNTFYGKLGNLLNVGFDFLTLTTSKEASGYLLKNTEFIEARGGQQGFSESQIRSCTGGNCTRRMKPFTKSNEYGLDYESWLFTSSLSDYWVRHCSKIDHKCKPTRLDVAFDFKCDSDLYPRHFIEAFRKHIENHRLSINCAGDEFKGTRYVGSRKSEIMIRIYRKDLEDVLTLKKHGSVLRVEIVFQRGSYQLEAIWDCLKNKTYTDALILANTNLWCKTEFEALPDSFVDIPKRPDDFPDAAYMVYYHLLNQHGATISNAYERGIDLKGLADLRCSQLSRSGQIRKQKKLDVLNSASGDFITGKIAELFCDIDYDDISSEKTNFFYGENNV